MNTVTASALDSDDLDLVERHRHGDAAAFDEVYHRYETLVYNLALRMSGSPDDAADLAQEVFLRVYRHLEGFRGRSSLKTWVFRVALNCCRSRLRRRHRRRALRVSEGERRLDEVPDPAVGPEERALAHDLGGQLEAALRELPLQFREAVVLRDVQGLSYQEIAEVVGVRIGTVRSRIARGRDRLRERLEKES